MEILRSYTDHRLLGQRRTPTRAALDQQYRILELGRHLERRGEGWWIAIGAKETKTRQPIALPFPDTRAPALERYLAVWRPLLASPDRVARSQALWLTQEGQPISPTRASWQIERHTRRAFGWPVNPHLFRHAAATTIALAQPEQVGLITPLLGHRTLGTAQRTYNLARAAEAAGAWHGLLDELGKRRSADRRRGGPGDEAP